MDRGHRSTREVHPRESANVLSRLSFFYTIKLFIRGFKTSLESYDLYEVLSSCRSKQLGDQLNTEWEKEKQKKKPSICRALLRCYGKTFIILGIMQLVMKLTTTIWSAEALSKLIAYFSPEQKELTKQDAIYYASVVITLNLINLIFYHNYILALTELGIRVKTAISSLLYRKTLKLNNESLSNVTVGKITTIITKDVDAFEMLIYYGNDMWIAIVTTGVICYLIYFKIGTASFAGAVFFLIILPLQVFIGKMGYKFRLESNKKSDERLELLQQVLSAVKVIKMYTWEKYFEDKICVSRKEELSKLHKLFYTKVWIMIIGSMCSKVAFFIFMMTYVWLGNKITAEIVYYIISCFNELEESLSNVIPYGFSYAAEVYATSKRILTVLKAKELTPHKEQETSSRSPEIIFKRVTVQISGKILLKNISLSIPTGLSVLVGHVGVGKTTFLKIILQDCEIQGDLQVLGTVSYASQEPWLFPSTIKNNILFGEKYCEKRYQKVLKLCRLEQDLEAMSQGDETVVADKGVNLSKGQQARINLARAVYKESDIYLFDDSLAALDTRVSNEIFKECMQNFLKNKICIFVTNNFNYIQQADNVLSINNQLIEVDLKPKADHHFDRIMKNTESGDETKERQLYENEIYHENKKSGKVGFKVYHKYVSYGGGLFIFLIIMSLFVIAQGVASYSDKLLSEWVTSEQNLSSFGQNETDTNTYKIVHAARTYYLNIYSAMAIVTVMLAIVRSFAYFNFTKVASINLHRAMVHNVVNSTMKFFDSTFVGNVINRFSKDCYIVDEYLPFVLIDCLMMVFTASGGIILLTSVSVTFLIESIILIAVAGILKMFYQPTGRNLQRLNAISRSPLIGHLNSTLEGLTTIRASRAQEIVIEEFHKYQNVYTSANYILRNSTIALAFGLELFCAAFIAMVILQFLITDFDPNVGDVGLAISQAFVVSDIIISGIKNLSDCENKMTSVERMLEFTELQEEPNHVSFVSDWPKDGKINFNRVSLTFNNSQEVLKDVNFTIKSKGKLGIVGRTGSGKSSIISALFRLYDIQGQITIDGLDIRDLPLQCLRSNIAIVPQEPFLFSGTVRENLDPYGLYQDYRIWQILEELNLKYLIQDLDMRLNKGLSFSAGQKQLLCLARAILKESKILILDEATANVDNETDSVMHKAVQKNFWDCTVIIIAHRLLSVLNSHQVVVIDQGRIREFGEPMMLLSNKNSFLHSVVK